MNDASGPPEPSPVAKVATSQIRFICWFLVGLLVLAAIGGVIRNRTADNPPPLPDTLPLLDAAYPHTDFTWPCPNDDEACITAHEGELRIVWEAVTLRAHNDGLAAACATEWVRDLNVNTGGPFDNAEAYQSMELRLLYIDAYQHAVLAVIDAHDGASMDSWDRKVDCTAVAG